MSGKCLAANSMLYTAPAVLDEYKHAKDFSRTENICIHVILALNYAKQEWNCANIIDNLKMLMSNAVEDELKTDLGNEYINFNKDYSAIIKAKAANL